MNIKELFFNPDLSFVTILKAKFFYHLPDILTAAIILAVCYLSYFVISFILKHILQNWNIDKSLIHISNSVLRVCVILIAVLLVAWQFGINISAALAGIGVVGIAIGFASQDALSNIIAGLFIFFDKPFKLGDYITYQSHYGIIKQITLRSTRIRTQDNTYVVIPNNKIVNDVVVDHSTNGKTRIVVSASIAYKESIDKAREAILQKVATVDGVITNPAPDVVVSELLDSGVKLLVRVWINDATHETRVRFDTTETVKKALDEAHIEIPFPQLQLHISDIKDSVIKKILEINK